MEEQIRDRKKDHLLPFRVQLAKIKELDTVYEQVMEEQGHFLPQDKRLWIFQTQVAILNPKMIKWLG